MTQKPSNTHRNIRTQSQFLVSSSNTTDTTTVKKTVSVPETVINRDILAKEYPRLQIGSLFVERTLQRLENCDRFAVMVFQLEPTREENTPSLCRALAGFLHETCARESGWCGLIDPNRFTCFLPFKTEKDCEPIGQTLQAQLRSVPNGTVSIGIAVYPTAGYAKDQVLPNADKALNHAGFLGPDSQVIFDDVSLNISGDHLFQKGDIPAAIAEYAMALILQPSNINVRNSLGVCHGLLGAFDSAVEEFETALALAPDEFIAQYNLGLVHMLKGDREQALSHLIEANRLSEDVYEVTLQTGRLHLEIGKAQEALSYLEKALRLNPTALAYRLTGDCHRLLSRSEEAITAYTQAVKQNPNDSAALSALGLLYALKGENPEIAVLFCEKSVEISPAEGIYRHRLGEVYLKYDRLTDAIAAFQAAVERGYDSSQLIEEIAKRPAFIENEAGQHILDG